MEARITSISPQPVAVDATVAAVTAAFGHASKLLQQIKSGRTEANAEIYLLPLEESITRALKSIDNEWDEGTERFGAAFELGDRMQHWLGMHIEMLTSMSRHNCMGAAEDCHRATRDVDRRFESCTRRSSSQPFGRRT